LVSRVVPDDRFDEEVARIAARLASGAPMPIRAIKEAVRAQYWDGPDRAAVIEERWAQKILASADAQEGMGAFREKRMPTFVGR
jgi:enoyl-CoA hydratase/carnithine racemase